MLRLRPDRVRHLMEPSAAPGKIRVLLVEDHAAVRAGIRGLLRKAADMELVGEAADGPQAVELVDQCSPDLMLLDMELPTLRGDEVMRQVLKKAPHVRVLVLSSYDDLVYIKTMLADGARGYLLKDEAPELLLTAIRSIHSQDGTKWLSPRVSQIASAPSEFEQELSWRELTIVENLLAGWSAAEIAAQLDLTEQQLDKHLQMLMRKFDVSSVDALLEIARRMIPPGS